MKVLFYGETPVLETGAARVNRHLLDTIVECGHEVTVIGTSHFCEENYDHVRYPFPIIPVDGEDQMKTHQNAGDMIVERNGTFDVLFISGDMHVPNILGDIVKHVPSIVLGAIDNVVKHSDQVSSFIDATFPVVYSQHAYNEVCKVLQGIECKLQCIPLGCEPDVFYPLPEDERRAYRKKAFGIGDETFLVMWANRNQRRKDPARAMAAFKLFHDRVPDSKLYMHTRVVDMGGNLRSQAIFLDVPLNALIFPQPAEYETLPDGSTRVTGYTEMEGFSRDVLNKLYNAADVGISTSQGEGWGLTTTEFMAAGTPFIGPANTSFYEILGEDEARGYLVSSGGPELWQVFYGTDDSPRPVTSVMELADTIRYVQKQQSTARAKAKAARAWTELHTWDEFKYQWREVLNQCEAHLSLGSRGKMVAI